MKLNIPDGSWPPGGWQYFDPATNYRETKPTEHDRREAAQAIFDMRQNNKHIYKGQELTYQNSLLSLELFTARRLLNRGLTQYVLSTVPVIPRQVQTKKKLNVGAAPAAKSEEKSLFNKLRQIAGGAATLKDWVGNGQRPVAQELANLRASTCVSCPLNQKGGALESITRSIGNAIKSQTELKNHLQLATPDDAKLLTCSACECHLPLKVWTPIRFISEHLEPDVYIELDRNCWILKEL